MTPEGGAQAWFGSQQSRCPGYNVTGRSPESVLKQPCLYDDNHPIGDLVRKRHAPSPGAVGRQGTDF